MRAPGAASHTAATRLASSRSAVGEAQRERRRRDAAIGHEEPTLRGQGRPRCSALAALFSPVTVIDITADALGAGTIAYLVLALACALRFRLVRPSAPGRGLPPLSVLKPLHGEEPRLYECLRSFCTQIYPGELQVIFGIADPNDPAAEVARRLIREFPERDLVLVQGARARGANRKVANLLGMLPAARHGLLAISDSDALLAGPDHLAAVAAELDGAPQAGAVTSLYRARPVPGAASRFAAMHIDDYFLTSALVALHLSSPDLCLGPLTISRRDALEAAGGLGALADQMADDAVLGRMLRRAGFGVRVSSLLVGTVVSETPASLWRHELRWSRTVRSTRPAGHAAMLVTHNLLVITVAAVLHPSALTVTLPVVALALRTTLHRAMARRLGVRPAPVWQIAWREAACFAVWLASYMQRTVEWQGVVLRLGPGGQLAGTEDAADRNVAIEAEARASAGATD